MGSGGSGLGQCWRNCYCSRTESFPLHLRPGKVDSEQGDSLLNRDSVGVPLFTLTLSASGFESEPAQRSHNT